MSRERIVFDEEQIARARFRHHSVLTLGGTDRHAVTQRVEFECRYHRCLAEFGESDSDVYVSTYSKSGTTWTQVIAYQLTTSGEMDFDHLFDVSPWVWYSALRGVKPATTPAPRLLKSHDDYRRFRPKRRGRIIFVVRDGRDVCVSLYHHRRNFKGFSGTFEQHVQHFLHDPEYNWFEHLRPWMQNDAQLPILYVRYEDLKRRFSDEVRRIADFMEVDLDEKKLERVSERCSFPAMKKHERQLGPRDEHFIGIATPYSVKKPDQFIRRGEVGEGLSVLSSAQLSAYQKRFDETLSEFPLLLEYR